jgi:putative flippase GtrA
MIRTLAQHQIIRYLFVGGFSYVIEIAVLDSANHILQLSAAISVTISFWVGFIVAYILQKIVAFQNKEKSRKAITKQLIGYGLLVLWNYGFTLIVVELFHTSVSVIVLRTIVIAITTIWNYVLYKKLFKVNV